jgi:hypothetical protein
VINKPTVPLSQPLMRGTVGQCQEWRDSQRDTGGTTSLKALAALALGRDSKRDSSGTEAGQDCPTRENPPGQPMCDISGDNQLIGNNPEATTAGYECCECGELIAEPIVTWWGGLACHRACGEAAWRRAVAEGRYRW